MAITIQSPLPGIFYRRADPDSEPYVNEGQTLAEGDVIGLVEIMKAFHEVRAEQSGKVVRFLVENGDPIDIGQDLLELEP